MPGLPPPESTPMSLGEFPDYCLLGLAQVSWFAARVGEHRLFPFAFHISVFFHSLLICHWISFVLLLYDRRICTHSIDPSLADGEFPGLGLALVPDVVRGGAQGAREAEISFQISILAEV